MKKTVVAAIAVAGVVILAGAGWLISRNTNQTAQMTGSDRDEHDCIGSAGYSWCEKKQKCLRMWEESCNPEIKIGYILRFYERDGRKYLDFDEVKWLSAADGTCSTDVSGILGLPGCGPDGYLIVNESVQAEPLDVVTETVTLTSDFEFNQDGRREVSYRDFTFLAPDHFSTVPYEIEMENGRIFAIRERYIP